MLFNKKVKVYKFLRLFTKQVVYYRGMNRFIKLLLLTPMAFSISGCQKTTPTPEPKPDPTPVNVILISGQSNGVGCAKTAYIRRSMGYDKYQEYLKGYKGVQISYQCWDKPADKPIYKQNFSEEDSFVDVRVGQGNFEGAFGPEIGIAEALHEEYDNKLFIIKMGCGASNLKDDWVRSGTPMYKKFINYVKAQMKKLEEMNYAPTIRAMCWMQGEGDSYPGYYQVYYENTKEFVSSLRTEFKELAGNKDFPFIDAGIFNDSQWEYYQEVNEAKQRFAAESENNIYFGTIEANLHTDQEDPALHFDSESMVELGHLFASKFKPFLEK